MLVRREHSRQELETKLARKLAGPLAEAAEGGIEPGTLIESVLEGLGNRKFQSDERYARQRITQRGARYGDQRLKFELSQQGVGDETIQQALAAGDDEFSRCRAVWQKKFGEIPESREEMAKQVRFLQYRGFSGATIRQVLKTLPDELNSEEA